MKTKITVTTHYNGILRGLETIYVRCINSKTIEKEKKN